MAHIKSSIKRARQSEVRRLRNIAVKSRMKTFVKSAADATEDKDADKLRTALPAALSEIDRAASKGILHANSAARKKSTLQRNAAAALQPKAEAAASAEQPAS